MNWFYHLWLRLTRRGYHRWRRLLWWRCMERITHLDPMETPLFSLLPKQTSAHILQGWITDMPTYVYECGEEKCKHKFEDIHGYDAPSPACPECGSPCKRIPSFSGGGLFGDTPKFYRNRK